MSENFENSLEIEKILAELSQLEPLIYAANDGKPKEYFDTLLVADFWEVGASGKMYERDFVLETLAQRKNNPRQEKWRTFDFRVRQIEQNHFLFTYSLEQPIRLSRRASLWERTLDGWKLIYHQGTPAL